jgi:two-component system, response regulator RegA
MALRAKRIKRVLVVDDQESWLRALERDAGAELVVFTATDAAQARQIADREHPDLAIVDLRLGSDSGLQLVSDLRAQHKRMKIVLISSFMTIPATVAAMKAGADHVDTKPITCRQLIAKLEAGTPSDVAGTSSLARMEWEYVQRVLDECGGNRSQAARTLGIYRQSLQRMLRKHPPPT